MRRLEAAAQGQAERALVSRCAHHQAGIARHDGDVVEVVLVGDVLEVREHLDTVLGFDAPITFQGKQVGREITLFTMWYELRWGITACVVVGLTGRRGDVALGFLALIVAADLTDWLSDGVATGAILAVSDAIAFHQSVGLAAKAYRLRYLRDLWAERVRANPAVEVLTPNDPDAPYMMRKAGPISVTGP